MKHWKKIFIGLLAFHLFLLMVTQFTAWPEMLFWPYLILKGWLPYRDIGIAHSPLLVIELATFYKLFGVGIWQQKIVSWLVPLFTDGVLLYFFSKLYGIKKAILALAFYILFQVYYDGNGIWFDHALTVFSIMIFYFLEKKKYFWTGLLWAVSFLTKQTAFWFSIPILYYFLVYPNKKKFVVDSLNGFLPVVLLFIVILVVFGIQKDYFHWSIVFGIFILPKLAVKISSIRLLIVSLIPYLVFIPLFLSKLNKRMIPILLWSISGMMGIFPRFELFHFQPALPFLALGAALLLGDILASKKKTFPFISLALLFLTLTVIGRGLVRKFHQEDRFYTASDKKVVGVVAGLVTANQTIFVTNYWDNLYPFTDTLPAIRPFIPQLTQYINQPGTEDNIVVDLKTAKSKVVVRGIFNTPGSKVYRFEKINNFVDNNYKKIDTVGEIEIMEIK